MRDSHPAVRARSALLRRPDAGHAESLPAGGDIPPARQPALPVASCPFPVLTAVGQKIPQVKAVVHVVAEKMTVMTGDFQAHETVTVVDPNFFQVLRIPFVQGDPTHALAQPESVCMGLPWWRCSLC